MFSPHLVLVAQFSPADTSSRSYKQRRRVGEGHYKIPFLPMTIIAAENYPGTLRAAAN